jgi:hypothetical protein
MISTEKADYELVYQQMKQSRTIAAGCMSHSGEGSSSGMLASLRNSIVF